jgi:hypothetical protein
MNCVDRSFVRADELNMRTRDSAITLPARFSASRLIAAAMLSCGCMLVLTPTKFESQIRGESSTNLTGDATNETASDTVTVDQSADAWANVVDEFALRIAAQHKHDAQGQNKTPGDRSDNAHLDSLLALLRPNAGAREFDVPDSSPLVDRLAQWGQYRLISARAYRSPAVSVASDLVADVLRSGDVPADIVNQLVPDKTEDLRRQGDSVALKFIDALLAPKANDPIGVVTLLDQTSEKPRLVLLLVRGVEVTENKKKSLRISGALFGDLEQALKAL